LHFNDRRALMMTLAVPLVIASFFGFIMGGQTGKPKGGGITVQVADQDQSAISKRVITNLMNDSTLRIALVTEDQARDNVLNGRVPVGVVMPSGFGDQASRSFFGWSQKPELVILHDPSHNAEVNLVKGLLMQHIMETVSREMFSGKSGQKYVREG